MPGQGSDGPRSESAKRPHAGGGESPKKASKRSRVSASDTATVQTSCATIWIDGSDDESTDMDESEGVSMRTKKASEGRKSSKIREREADSGHASLNPGSKTASQNGNAVVKTESALRNGNAGAVPESGSHNVVVTNVHATITEANHNFCTPVMQRILLFCILPSLPRKYLTKCCAG